MNHDYEKEYEESTEELYAASIALRNTGYINIVGENDEVFVNYDKAVERFNEAQKNFFGDTLTK